MENNTIYCSNCQKSNPTQNLFCQYCGYRLEPAEPKSIPSEPEQREMPSRGRVSLMDLLTERITRADGERTVRTYFCTYYKSKMLGLMAHGYLSVTNRRLIFHAQGESSAGQSVIQSEVPIADVSGISSYKGTYFSFGSMLVAFIASVVVSGFVSSIFPVILGLLVKPRDFDAYTAIEWLIAIVFSVASFFIKNSSIWRSILASTGASAFTFIGGLAAVTNLLGSALGRANGGQLIAILIAIAMVFYTIACIIWYSRRPTFSLAVNSKGGSSTPINISGATGIGIFDMAAGKALSAEPAQDAEQMLKELGAVVLDIQTMGDYGIQKWAS